MRLSQQFIREIVLRRDEIASFDAYPFSLPVVRDMRRLALHPAVTFFVGENGSGKSTLLEAIAVAAGFNAEGGSKNFNFTTRASHSPLCERLRLVRGVKRPTDGYFLRAESFFNVATEIEKLDSIVCQDPLIGDAYGARPLHEQSHGESFFSLMTQRFHGNGLYILDEPEAALSPMRQMAFLTLVHDLVRAKSQFIVATHSPIIMAYPESRIYACCEKGLRRTRYTDTEHYRVTRDFLMRYPKMMEILMAP